ncbi:MAG: hypothetical protein QRY71_05760 [Candidatus Rhabdochlamydia sp.]
MTIFFILLLSTLSFLWIKAPAFLAKTLSHQLGVQVEIGSLHLSYNQLSLRDFKLHNPEKYTLPLAFSCKEAIFQTPFTRLLSKHIVIEQITLSHIYLSLEFDSLHSTEGNWSALFSNMQPDIEEPSGSQDSRSLMIKKMVIQDIQTELYYQKEGKTKKLKTIPQITLNSINTEGTSLIDQLLGSTLGQAVKQIFIKENLKGVLESLLKTPSKALKETLSPLKNLFTAETLEEFERIASSTPPDREADFHPSFGEEKPSCEK